MRHSIHRHAFTLIELLVVIAIIGALSVLISTVLIQAQEKARATTCQMHLKDCGNQLLQKTMDIYNATAAPVLEGVEIVDMPCGCQIPIPFNRKPRPPILLEGCPKAPKNPLYLNVGADEVEPRTLSYGSIDPLILEREWRQEPDQWLYACSDMPVVTELGEIAFQRHLGAVNVFFLDAHVGRVKEKDFPWPE